MFPKMHTKRTSSKIIFCDLRHTEMPEFVSSRHADKLQTVTKSLWGRDPRFFSFCKLKIPLFYKGFCITLFLFAKLFFQFANSKFVLRFQLYFFRGLKFYLRHFLFLQFYFSSFSISFFRIFVCSLVANANAKRIPKSAKTISIIPPPHFQL